MNKIKKVVKKSSKHRAFGKIEEVARKTTKRGTKRVTTYTLRVFTGQSSFENTLSQQQMDDLIPLETDDPGALVGRYVSYVWRTGGKRRIQGLGDGITVISWDGDDD